MQFRFEGMDSFELVFVTAILSLALVPIIAVLYSYDTLSVIESGAGFALLLTTSAGLWLLRPRLSRPTNTGVSERTTRFGIGLGLLWLIEIGINNLIAPPLPWRDVIDNIFWAAIALAIFLLAVITAYRSGSLRYGMGAGAWSGFVSGLLACWSSLALIVFGMHFITADPLNGAEWAVRAAGTGAPTMAAYFAFETFAGAFLHLVVLGVIMGSLLGVFGGLLGKGVRRLVP